MELFKYIVKFIYRIRWWMVIFPCIAGIIAWFLTRSLEKTYDVKTTIFTGIISGYNVDATDTRNATVHMSNLMNIITTERTLKIVSLKLLARCLVYGDAERNTSYISAIHYQQLVSGIPRELQALIDKQNEEKTYHNLVAFERPSINNFIYQLLNYTHPYFSVPLLSQHIKVARLGNSDMIEIAYSANDPGIAYNTLEILNEEFVKQYHELRYGETDNVIKFFQEELARLGKMLTAAEDSLIEYNIENRMYNIEIQRDDRGASVKRARYNSSLIDANITEPGEQYENLNETYVIFITEHDVLKGGRPIYCIERTVQETGESFGDGTHILYVNAQMKDDTALGQLMHDFACTSADEMHYQILADRVRYFKEDKEGVATMCKIMEDMKNEAAKRNSIETARVLLAMGKLSYEEIAQSVRLLTVDEVKALDEGKPA